MSIENLQSMLGITDLSFRGLVFEKFKDVMDLQEEGQDCVLYPKGVAQRIVAERRGEGTLEFVNMYRTSTSFSWSRHRTPAGRRGLYMQFADPDKTGISVAKAVPVDIEYTIWFWSKSFDKLLLAVERYMFWVHSNPNMNLLVNDVYPMTFYMAFGAINDESIVAEQFEQGQYFVVSAPVKMDAWVFDTTSLVKTVKYIHVALWDSTVGESGAVLLRDWWIPNPPPP